MSYYTFEQSVIDFERSLFDSLFKDIDYSDSIQRLYDYLEEQDILPHKDQPAEMAAIKRLIEEKYKEAVDNIRDCEGDAYTVRYLKKKTLKEVGDRRKRPFIERIVLEYSTEVYDMWLNEIRSAMQKVLNARYSTDV
jgi:hypothetical protein